MKIYPKVKFGTLKKHFWFFFSGIIEPVRELVISNTQNKLSYPPGNVNADADKAKPTTNNFKACRQRLGKKTHVECEEIGLKYPLWYRIINIEWLKTVIEDPPPSPPHKCISQFFPPHLNTYVMGLRPISAFYPYSAVIDLKRKNLTSIDVRLWRLKSIPALKR